MRKPTNSNLGDILSKADTSSNLNGGGRRQSVIARLLPSNWLKRGQSMCVTQSAPPPAEHQQSFMCSNTVCNSIAEVNSLVSSSCTGSIHRSSHHSNCDAVSNSALTS